MGHYWREMDPSGAAEHDRRIDRRIKLREKLKDMPLSSFTVGDLKALHRVMNTFKEAREEDFDRLEKKIQEKP